MFTEELYFGVREEGAGRGHWDPSSGAERGGGVGSADAEALG